MNEWFPKRTLGSLPAEAAAQYGNREALCFKGQRSSFRQFSEDVDRAPLSSSLMVMIWNLKRTIP